MVSRDGLVAEYLLQGTAADSSGSGAHGTVHGAVPTPDRFGRPNGAFLFDGRDNFIEITPPPPLSADPLSVSVWARCDAFRFEGWNNCIIAQDDGDDNDRSRRILQISLLEKVRISGRDIPDISTTFYGMSEFRLEDPDGNAIWIGGTAD